MTTAAQGSHQVLLDANDVVWWRLQVDGLRSSLAAAGTERSEGGVAAGYGRAPGQSVRMVTPEGVVTEIEFTSTSAALKMATRLLP